MAGVMSVIHLLVLLVWHRGNFCSAASAFRSIRAPADTIREYQIHVPVVTVPFSDQKLHPQQLHVQLSHFKLSLELNSGLIHPKFSSRYFDESGREVIEKGHVNCFYQGSVEGHTDWQVTMSTCQGLQGSFGRYGSDEFYHVEPLDPGNLMLEQAHALYLDSQYTQHNGTCGTSTHKPIPISEADSSQSYDGPLINQHRLHRRLVNGFYIVEWAIINDNAQYMEFGSNLSAVVMRNLEIANYVDTLYRPLNIRVVVVNVMTWTMGNPITYPADFNANDILTELTEYVSGLAVQRDSLMLMTGVNLLGSTVGLAFVGTMCNLRSSVGLTQDMGGSMAGVGSTAAHELGHIFNMNHDDDRGCTCTDPAGRCIMAAVSVAGSFSTQWSSCSRTDLNTGFSTRNLNRCLNNEPQITVGDPSCGNGIREGNEVCDCGSVQECTDPCCNATTCTLREGAQCSEGRCCSDTCQFLSYGTTCRAAGQECDIAEYCSGSSSDCPRDVYRQDGTPCNQSVEFCFSGVCRSLDARCQQFYQSESAVSECYSQLNTRGTRFGNCGTSGGQFVPCDTEHVQCGQLFCNGGTFQRSQVPGQSILLNRETITVNSTVRATCSSFTLPATSDTISPGLVPDGTRCGNTSVCVSQACVELSSLQYIVACPTGNNGQTCSGNGICNNLNECSCSVGFSNSNCDSSVSSSSSSSRTGVIVGAVLGTIFGLILAGVVIAVIIFVVIKFNSKKKSVPLTARSRPTGSNLGKSRTGSQDNLLDDSNQQDKVSVRVVKPSRGYQPPPMRGSPPPMPESSPAGQRHYVPAKPTPSSSKPSPVVNRYIPNSSNPKPKPPTAYRPGPPPPPSKVTAPPPSKPTAPPPSRAMPPPPSKAMPPPPSHKSTAPSAPPRSGVPPPHLNGGSSAYPRKPPSVTASGAPPPKPQQHGSKLSNLQKQWPPPAAGGNVSPSTSKKPVPPSKKPLAPPRR